MRVLEILNEMITTDAIRLFARLGYDISKMTPDEIKTARNQLMQKYHPDRGGDGVLAQNINLAYDTLKDYISPEPASSQQMTVQPQQRYYQPTTRKETEPERPRNDFRQSWSSKKNYGY